MFLQGNDHALKTPRTQHSTLNYIYSVKLESQLLSCCKTDSHFLFFLTKRKQIEEKFLIVQSSGLPHGQSWCCTWSVCYISELVYVAGWDYHTRVVIHPDLCEGEKGHLFLSRINLFFFHHSWGWREWSSLIYWKETLSQGWVCSATCLAFEISSNTGYTFVCLSFHYKELDTCFTPLSKE